MKAVLICPDRRAEVAFLARKTAIALMPLFGRSLVAHWLAHLAAGGVKEVTVLASDRPDQIRREIGRGERWGLKVEVLAQSHELSVAKARALFSVENVVLADYLPALPDRPLLVSYKSFFEGLRQALPLAHRERVGVREIAPQVWAGLRCRVDPTAKLAGPCWLGENVWVRSGAVVGPDVVIEDSALVDHDAEVTNSWIGPWTYVGALTHVKQSMAWDEGLLNHVSGSFTEIQDLFLLGSLRGERGFIRRSPWYGRALAFLAAAVTSPLVLWAALKNRAARRPLWLQQRAVIPAAMPSGTTLREMNYTELNGVSGLARRWPQLWDIVRGDFTWVGNRPLTREQAAQLVTEFEQLWLVSPIGLVSLADALGCADRFDDETRAHASFYAACANRRLDRAVLRWLILRVSPKMINR